MYSRMLGVSGVPTQLGHWIEHFQANLGVILVIFVIVLLILGTMIDAASTLLIAVPLFLPVVSAFNVDLVWFGIVAVIGAEIGILTPPLGIAVYVIKSTLDTDTISLNDIFAGAFPFACITLLVLILIILVPSISLVLI